MSKLTKEKKKKEFLASLAFKLDLFLDFQTHVDDDTITESITEMLVYPPTHWNGQFMAADYQMHSQVRDFSR